MEIKKAKKKNKMEFFRISKGKIITFIILILLSLEIWLGAFVCDLTNNSGSACMLINILGVILIPVFLYGSILIEPLFAGVHVVGINGILYNFLRVIIIIAQIFYCYLLSCIIVAIIRKVKGGN